MKLLDRQTETNYLPRMAKKQLRIDADELKALEIVCGKCGTSMIYRLENGFRNGGQPAVCSYCSTIYSEPLMTALRAYGQFRLAAKDNGSEMAFIVDVE